MINPLFEIYYDLFDVFEDLDILTDALRELTGSKKTKSCILINLQTTRLHNVDMELNCLYDMKMPVLRDFKIKCKARYQSHGYQTCLMDFMDMEA